MDNTLIPKHIAIIMDGNGRWARARGYPRSFGHIRGCRRVKEIVREADRLGVKALTLFAFSTENWSRPSSELTILWKLLKKYLIRESDELHEKNVRLRIIGERERLDATIRRAVDETVERLSSNTGLQLNIAVSYGGRAEIIRACKKFAQDCLAGKTRIGEMDESFFWKYLWTADLGPLAEVDLIIRTSGEHRVSNFLSWQGAYSEYFFVPTFWPDFTATHLRDVVLQFSQRGRRFGGTESPVGLFL